MTYISTGKVIDPSTTVQYVSYITQDKNMEERIYASIKYVLTLYISTIAKHASTSLNKKMYIGMRKLRLSCDIDSWESK